METRRVVGLWAKVWLEDSDITAVVEPYLTKLNYKDYLEGNAADRIEVTLEDSRGLFQDRHYPKKGASLHFEFGLDRQGGPVTFDSEAGFEIESIQITGPPDVVVWTGSAQKPGGPIHNLKARAWENTTLKEIASTIARERGLKLVYDAEEDISFRRKDQFGESDLGFLRSLSKKYGIMMSLKSGREGLTIVMMSVANAMKGKPVFEITKQIVTRFSFDDKAVQGTGGAKTQYLDVENKRVVQHETEGEAGGHQINTFGVTQAAQQHLQGTADNAKKDEVKNNITLPGNPRLVSGVMVNLSGWGWYDGKWLVTESEHNLDVAGGYTTNVVVVRAW